MESLKIAYPEAEIDWVVEKKSADLLIDHPYINECLVFERDKNIITSMKKFINLCYCIQRKKYDLVLDFHGIIKSGLISWFSKASYRYSFAPPRAQEFSHLFATYKIYLPPGITISRVEENFELIKAVGALPVDYWRGIEIPIAIEEEIDNYLQKTIETNKELVLIHPAVERPEKQWPLEYFSKLSDLLISDGRFEVMLSWGPNQLEIVKQVSEMMKHKVHIAPQTPTLKHLACLISRSKVFVSGDTGPMHLAWLIHHPLIAIFGGTNPIQHAPRGPNCISLYKGPTPFPPKMSLHQAQLALKNISPEEVYETILKITHAPN
ncbi:MAG: glycosyltransferase family 9 protein [Candidatus Hydrogenedentes bacterium]|nr:glycosyltransferase family 9 protein [Candidatus Hydrogenedentota bacterium]